MPLTVDLTLVDDASAGTPLAGAAVYVWHCDREGGYSLYSSGVDRPELPARRAGGRRRRHASRFTSIFPAAYSGRWPHIHFEVYPDLATATSVGSRLATSQLALPEDACDDRVRDRGYEQSVSNLAQTSLADATWSSATAGTASSRRSPAPSTAG